MPAWGATPAPAYRADTGLASKPAARHSLEQAERLEPSLKAAGLELDRCVKAHPFASVQVPGPAAAVRRGRYWRFLNLRGVRPAVFA